LLGLAILVLGGCGLISQPTAAPTGTRTARGILIDVQGASLQRAESFTLRTDEGREMIFKPAQEFNVGVSHAMTPGHMRQHMALADPVTITYREELDGVLTALSATD
jgi:hypothetical protein